MWIIRYSEKYICTTAKRSFETKVGVGKGRTENGGVEVLSRAAQLRTSISMHNDQEYEKGNMTSHEIGDWYKGA